MGTNSAGQNPDGRKLSSESTGKHKLWSKKWSLKWEWGCWRGQERGTHGKPNNGTYGTAFSTRTLILLSLTSPKNRDGLYLPSYSRGLGLLYYNETKWNHLERVKEHKLSASWAESHALSGPWQSSGLTANPYLLTGNITWLVHTSLLSHGLQARIPIQKRHLIGKDNIHLYNSRRNSGQLKM